MQTDGQTDMTNLTVALRNFANAHKNWTPLGQSKSQGISW